MTLTSFSTISLGLLAFWRLKGRYTERDLFLLSVVCTTFILMLPFAAPIWKAIPALSVVQFPFRFGSILLVAVGGLIASALDCAFEERRNVRSFRSSAVLAVAVLLTIGTGILVFGIDGGFRERKGSVDYRVTDDIDHMYRSYVAARHLRAFAESIGSKPDTYGAEAVPGEGTFRAELIGGMDCAGLTRETPRSLLVSADCQGDTRLRIGQLYFSLWRLVPIGGTSHEATLGASAKGLMELSLAPGKQELRLVYDAGRAEWWGQKITIASLLGLMVGEAFAVQGRIRHNRRRRSAQ